MLPLASQAAVIVVDWIGGVDMTWSTGGNWSTGVVPDNNATNLYNVSIDGGDTATDVSVLLTGEDLELESLTIDTGDELKGYGLLQTKLLNSGVVSATSGDALQIILSGSGSTNSGTIQAINSGSELYINPQNDSIFLNNTGGLIKSTGGANYAFIAGVNGGHILADGGSAYVANISGVTLNTSNDGAVFAETAFGALNAVTNNGTFTFKPHGYHPTLNPIYYEIPVLQGNWINDGVLLMDRTGEGLARISINGAVSLGGEGEFEFINSLSQVVSHTDNTDSLTIGADQTVISKIDSEFIVDETPFSGYFPKMGDNTLRLINNGLITTDGGFLAIHPGPGSVNNGVIRNDNGQLVLSVNDEMWNPAMYTLEPHAPIEEALYLDNTNGLIEGLAPSWDDPYFVQPYVIGVTGGELRGNLGIAYVKDATLTSPENTGLLALFGILDSLDVQGKLALDVGPRGNEGEPVATNILKGNWNNDGEIALIDDYFFNEQHSDTGMLIDGEVSFSGEGKIVMASQYRHFYGANSGSRDVLINAAGHSITSENGGSHNDSAATIGSSNSNEALDITNAGVIAADGGALRLIQEPDSQSANTGLIVSRNGGYLQLSYTNAPLNYFNNAGGEFRAESGSTMRIDGLSGGLVKADGGEVTVYDAVNDAKFQSINGGVINLDGVALSNTQILAGDGHVRGTNADLEGIYSNEGNLSLQISGNSYINNSLNGVVNNDGLITVEQLPNSTTQGYVKLGDSTTFSGTGNLLLKAGYLAGGYVSPAQLVNAQGHTIEGSGGIGLGYFFSLDNQGLIRANVAGEYLSVSTNADEQFNRGVMESSGGFLMIDGSSIDNTGGVIRANGFRSITQISGFGLHGGVLEAINDGNIRIWLGAHPLSVIDDVIFNTDNDGLIIVYEGTLSNVTNNGQTILKPYNSGDMGNPDYSKPRLRNTITNHGYLYVDDNFTYIDGEVTLQGTGALTFRNRGDLGSLNGNESDLLINAVGHTINGQGDIGGGTSLPFENHGLVDANVSGARLVVAPNGGSFINTGTMQASNGGWLYVDPGHLNNDMGKIQAIGEGSWVDIFGPNIQLSTISGGEFDTRDNGFISAIQCTLRDFTNRGDLRAWSYLYEAGSSSQNFGLTLAGDIHNFGLITGQLYRPLDEVVIHAPGESFLQGMVSFHEAGEWRITDGLKIVAANEDGFDGFTNGPDHTIRITQGSSLGNSSSKELIVVNHGEMIFDDSAGEWCSVYVNINGGFTNDGSISCLNGSFASIELNGAQFDNTGGVVSVDGADSLIGFSGDNLVFGGEFNTLNGGIIVNQAVFTDLTLNGEAQHTPGGRWSGDIVNNGVIKTFGSPDWEDGLQYPLFQGDVTLSGDGVFVVEYWIGGDASDGLDSLTNSVGHTIAGSGILGGAEVSGETSMTLINKGVIAPGASAGALTLAGGMTFNDTARLEIEIGGRIPGEEHDILIIDFGEMIMAGELAITFINGFENAVQPSDSFPIIDANLNASLSGSFKNILNSSRILTADGLGSFAVTYDDGDMVLSDFQAAPVAPSRTQSWAWEWFGDNNPATEANVWGLTANPDGDQFSNLLEYAFGLDPTDPNTNINPSELEDAASGFRLRLRQRKASNDPTLQYLIEVSASLLSGSWASADVSEVPPRESIDSNTEWVIYQLPEPEVGDPQFVRVKVLDNAP